MYCSLGRATFPAPSLAQLPIVPGVEMRSQALFPTQFMCPLVSLLTSHSGSHGCCFWCFEETQSHSQLPVHLALQIFHSLFCNVLWVLAVEKCSLGLGSTALHTDWLCLPMVVSVCDLISWLGPSADCLLACFNSVSAFKCLDQLGISFWLQIGVMSPFLTLPGGSKSP